MNEARMHETLSKLEKFTLSNQTAGTSRIIILWCFQLVVFRSNNLYNQKKVKNAYAHIHPFNWHLYIARSFVLLERGPAVFIVFITTNILSRTACYDFNSNLQYQHEPIYLEQKKDV